MDSMSSNRSVPTTHDHGEERQCEERSCFYCLDGIVFLGGLNEDGEEEYYLVYCRRCGGSGVLHAG
jgi:hypothetical protein